MADFTTPDLCDAHEDKVRVADPGFLAYGGKARFHGRIVTLKIFEDNTLVRTLLETPGEGRVLVVDGGGSKRCALVGDQLAQLGVENGWAGIIVYGCIRDSAEIAGMALGIKALGTHPKKSVKKGVGERDLAVTFHGVTFVPGEYAYSDEDGIVLASSPLL
jgi:regulator of ribonuclease activity A